MTRLKLTLILLCFMTMIQASNPFFEKYSTPHGTVPFNLIKTEHYAPAIHEGIRRQNAEIDAIINNPAAPTFENTIVPYEKSGELLHRVTTVFGNLLSAETSDELQELAREIMPLMSEHENNISLNEKLFARIKAAYELTDKNKKVILEERKEKAFHTVYDKYVENSSTVLNTKMWDKLQVNLPKDVKTDSFFEVIDRHMEEK